MLEARRLRDRLLGQQARAAELAAALQHRVEAGERLGRADAVRRRHLRAHGRGHAEAADDAGGARLRPLRILPGEIGEGLGRHDRSEIVRPDAERGIHGEREEDLLAQEVARRAAVGPAYELAECEAEGDGVIARRGAGRPGGGDGGGLGGAVLPVVHASPVERGAQRREAALVGQHVPQRARPLPALGELRPEIGERPVEREAAAVDEHQRGDGGDRLRRGEPDHPRLRPGGIAEAEIEGERPFPVDGELRRCVVAPLDVLPADPREPRPALLGEAARLGIGGTGGVHLRLSPAGRGSARSCRSSRSTPCSGAPRRPRRAGRRGRRPGAAAPTRRAAAGGAPRPA